MAAPEAIIILSRLKVQNVNAISSPLTWGFPAVTAILGFVHALERKVSTQYQDLKFGGVGIICHQFTPQVFQPNIWRDALFCLTRNPLEKDGGTAALVEEGRAHMEISLIIQGYGEDCLGNDENKKFILADLLNMAQTLRLAGGSFLPHDQKFRPSQLLEWPNTESERRQTAKSILRGLLPGFALISRAELLAERTDELRATHPQATALDALLEFASIHFEPELHDLEAEKVNWNIVYKKPGWVVPIPVGYSAISECYAPGTVLNARDNNYPCQFVESIYSLGEWRSPHRIKNLDDIFWHYQVDTSNGLYLCSNNPQDSI